MFEKKLLAKLMENARAPVYKLAQELGVSRQTASKWLKKLEQDLSLKYIALPDRNKLGLDVKAYVMVRVAPREDVRRRVESRVRKLKQIAQAHYIYGRYDMVLEVLAKDREDLSNLIDSLHEIEGVLETETFIVREVVKDRPLDPIIRALK